MNAAWSEYDSAAKWCARRNIRGDYGDPLPEALSADVTAEISRDVESFMARVNDFAYAQAMEETS